MNDNKSTMKSRKLETSKRFKNEKEKRQERYSFFFHGKGREIAKNIEYEKSCRINSYNFL